MFRRKQDEEDPFAALRDGTREGAPRVEVRETPSAPAPSGVPGTPRGRRGVDRLLILLTVVLALGGAGALVWMSEDDAGKDTAADTRNGAPADGRQTRGDAGDGRTEAADDKRTRPPKRLNLVRPAGLRQALRAVQRQLRPGERVTIVRLAPDRINVSTALRNGRQRLLNVAPDGTVDAMVAGSAGSRRGVPLSIVDPRAPWRAVRQAARQGRFATSKLDYLVLSAPIIPGEAADWSLFFDGVRARDQHWIAALDGAPVYRPGEQPGASTTTSSSTLRITTNGRTVELTGAEAARVTACVRHAGSDGAAIQRCLP